MEQQHRRVSNYSNRQVNNARISILQQSPYSYENREQMELELNHNKSMLQAFSQHTKFQAFQSFTQAQSLFQDTQDKILKMPPIRKYPVQRRKELMENQAISMPIGEEEKELDKKLSDQRKIEQFTGTTAATMYKVLFYNIPQDDWKPCAREGGAFVIDRNKAYLFGGIGQAIFNSLEVVELEHQLRWKTVEHTSAKMSLPGARFGHSMNYYKGNLIVFGGEKQFNMHFKERSCLLDIYLFNIEQRKWLFVNTSGDIPQARRCHAATVIGRWLIVHGGSNGRDVILGDLWAFDIGTSTWQELLTTSQENNNNNNSNNNNNNIQIKHFASAHQCCNVFYPSRLNRLQLFKSQEIKIPKWVPQIIHEGVYYFGGKDETGKASDKLRVLKIDCKPVQWIVPQTLGKQPPARYEHIVQYVCVLNLLVVFGGKNDDAQEIYLSDLHVLQIESLSWMQVEVNSSIPTVPRANHSAVVYDTKLLVFGGLNQHGYLTSHLQLIELDSNLTKQVLRKEQAQRLDFDADYLINDKSPSSGLRQLHQNGYSSSSSPPSFSKSIEARKSRQLDWTCLTNQDSQSQHDYKEIPFKHKIKAVEKEQAEVTRIIVEKLAFNNFPSFLPSPNKQSQHHLRMRSLSHAKDQQNQSQIIPETKATSPSPPSGQILLSPAKRFQKTVSKITALQSVLQKIKHA